MMPRQNISTFISRLALSIALLSATLSAQAQGKLFTIEKDSVPLLNGFAVSFDAAGPVILALSDYGEYEAAVRLNLHNQYFPIVEIGYGKADHDDEVTEIRYKTQAPYFRVGCDLNLLKNKHSANRLYAGLRYAFTSYKVDISRPTFQDPVWGHLGWSVRYKLRLARKDSSVGNTWYVPGYGKAGDTRIGANFNVIIDI